MTAFEFISCADFLEKTDHGVALKAKTDKGRTAFICVEFYFEDALRFKVYEDKEPENGLLVLPKPIPHRTQVSRSDGSIVISTNEIACRINSNPFHIQISNRDGKIIWEEQKNDYNVRGFSRVPQLGFVLEETEIQKVVEAFVIKPNESFFGYGEQFCCWNKRGYKITNWNVDAYGVETERAYKHIPFFLSSRGYGIFVNSTAKVRHFIGAPELSCSSYVLEVADRKLDYFVIWGPSFKKIITRYTDLTGKAPVPPIWAFGLWMSRCYYHDRVTVERVAQKLRDLRIPCDVIVFDSYWMRDGHLCDFVWDKKRFPDPEGMLAKLKNQGYKICLWEAPYVSLESELFDEGAKKGYFLKSKKGQIHVIDAGLVRASHECENFEGQETVGTFGKLQPAPQVAIVDFTNFEAAKWYQMQHEPLLQMGVDVFKTDFGEQVPEEAYSSYSGVDGRQLHNLYPLLYNRAVFKITERYKGQAIVWARSAWAGSQRYPVHWGGDPQTTFSSMAASLRGGLSLGLSGIPFWGHDIGGFYGKKPSPKLYIRWAQLGLLSPLARCHGTTPREPWEYGEEALRIFRKYTRLRYRLIPYLYSYAYQASRTGLPLMRPLVLEFQDDPATQGIDSQYLLGEWILVAPMFDESDCRIIYFPEGLWLDYWTRDICEGPRYLEYNAPLEILPLFIRAGAIIPQGPEMQFVGEKPFDPITLLVFPYKDSSFLLHLGDETVKITCSATSKKVVLSIGDSSRTYIAHILGIQRPICVESEKGPIQPFDNLDVVQHGWSWSPESELLIRCPSPPTKVAIYVKTGDLDA